MLVVHRQAAVWVRSGWQRQRKLGGEEQAPSRSLGEREPIGDRHRARCIIDLESLPELRSQRATTELKATLSAQLHDTTLSSFDAVDRIKAALDSESIFTEVQVQNARVGADINKVTFRVQMEVR